MQKFLKNKRQVDEAEATDESAGTIQVSDNSVEAKYEVLFQAPNCSDNEIVEVISN